MKISASSNPRVSGQVMVGPKNVRGCYVRIVSCKDGSGCIESYDASSHTWAAAGADLTFAEVWRAEPVTPQDWANVSGEY